MSETLINNEPNEVYEVVQLLSGDNYIFRGGYKEEADKKDVIRFEAGLNAAKQMVFNFSRFDFNPATPIDNIRLNRNVIAFAWYVDPKSDVIRSLKEMTVKMDAAKAGLIIPGAEG